MIFYQPKHFILQELVDKKTWQKYGKKAWEFLDPRALFSLDGIWELVNKKKRCCVYVNTWYWDGDRQWSGFRPFFCPIGTDNSPHRRGCAYDLVVEGIEAEDVRAEIMKYQFVDWQLKYITRLEQKQDGKPISWVHFDCVNIDKREGGIKLFNV